MPQQTDKVFRKLQAYLEEHDDEIRNEEDYENYVNQFMQEYNQKNKDGVAQLAPETSDDYLELAEEATSHKKRIEYAKKALKLDDNNLDAARIIIDETAKTPFEARDKYKKLVDKGTKILKRDGYFDKEFEGEFWLAFETRPYMRARYWYMRSLLDCGMMRLATSECQEMLKLCHGDNLGVRFELMHLYAYLEDEASATKLFKKYPSCTHLLLPYSILYYKLGDFQQSAKYLKKLASQNKDNKRFFRTINSKKHAAIDKLILELSPYGERWDSIDELIGEFMNYDYLTSSSFWYFEWGNQILKQDKNQK